MKKQTKKAPSKNAFKPRIFHWISCGPKLNKAIAEFLDLSFDEMEQKVVHCVGGESLSMWEAKPELVSHLAEIRKEMDLTYTLWEQEEGGLAKVKESYLLGRDVTVYSGGKKTSRPKVSAKPVTRTAKMRAKRRLLKNPLITTGDKIPEPV